MNPEVNYAALIEHLHQNLGQEYRDDFLAMSEDEGGEEWTRE